VTLDLEILIRQYDEGSERLRRALEGVTAAEWDLVPVPGQWSLRQVVCHLADAELLYAERIKRILAEDEPPLLRAEPEQFLAAMGGPQRDIEVELRLIESIRAHVGAILQSLGPEQFERRGIHSTDGPLTLRMVLERVVKHIPHHVAFIEQKRRALAAQQ
jgi:uncharacterized damage-inducible protein DinB